MGMLAFGAMAGVGDEYVKQSGEERKNKFQEIRDKRLAEIQKEGRIHSSELATTENMRQEGVSAAGAEIKAKADLASGEADRKNRLDIANREGDFTLGRGDTRHNAEGELIATGTEWTSTTAASAATQKWMAERVFSMNDAKTPTTRGELNDEWYRLAYDEVSDPDFPESGIKIKRRKPDTQDWVPWFNSQVQPKFRLKPNDPLHMVGDPQALFNYGMSTNAGKAPGARQGFIDALKKEYTWWKGPETKTGTQDQTVSDGDDYESGITSLAEGDDAGGGGMLNQAVNNKLGDSVSTIGEKIQDINDQIEPLSRTIRTNGLSDGEKLSFNEAEDAKKKMDSLKRDLAKLKEAEKEQKRKESSSYYNANVEGLKASFGQ